MNDLVMVHPRLSRWKSNLERVQSLAHTRPNKCTSVGSDGQWRCTAVVVAVATVTKKNVPPNWYLNQGTITNQQYFLSSFPPLYYSNSLQPSLIRSQTRKQPCIIYQCQMPGSLPNLLPTEQYNIGRILLIFFWQPMNNATKIVHISPYCYINVKNIIIFCNFY